MSGSRSALRLGATALLLLQTGVAAAQGALCLPGLNPRRVDGDLNVVTRCELDGTDVRGDVTLFAGGSLVARDVHIRGNLTGSSADFVDMDGGRVDGDVQLEQMVGDLIRFQGAELRGVELLGNRSRLEVLDNEIHEDLVVTANVGGVLITGNTIRNLECTDNAPAPLGGGNEIDRDASGQCEELELQAPEPPPGPPPPEPQPLPPEPQPPPPTPEPTPSPPPPATPPPTTPPVSSPPPSPPSASFVPDPNGGGGGAIGPGWILLVPFALWRRRRSPRAG